ncbi:MAG TPA: chemotaxis protein CheW [Gemmatimonadaceae bacterium]|nr:chemotaxis protein CheW [Gemmatimonadaceae bacterium]
MASIAPTAESPLSARPAGERILLFSIGNRTFGCPVDAVREIIPSRRATRIPGAPEYVLGLVNLRGSILTIIDLGLRLEEPTPARADGSTILVEYGQKVVGLTVDDVMDVQSIETERLESPTSAGEGRDGHAGVVRGLGHLGDGGVVILLDVHSLVRQILR